MRSSTPPTMTTSTTVTNSGRSSEPAVVGTGQSDSNYSESSSIAYVRNINSRNFGEMLERLPSSPKELLQRIERQRTEMQLMQEENLRLKSREVEVSALTLKLQQQFATTQSQVATIKTNIQLQLANPITEEEYNAIEALPEAKRDLLDTIKMGIYRQLGSLRASTQAATRRAAEIVSTVHQLTEENKDYKLQLAEHEAALTLEKQRCATKLKQAEQQGLRVLELEATVKDLEGKLRNAFLDQEQFLTAKLTAQVKTDEVARLSIRMEEAELDVQRYKANAECSEQKLDILKSEYYELKLKYGQRVLELESCLKAAEEKLKTLGDLEMESELFISNLAAGASAGLDHTNALLNMEPGSLTLAAPSNGAAAYESWLALPRSRKLAHTLTVTKRCLHLENRVASLQHDIEFKDKQMSRLQTSLSAAREALQNNNSPYAMVEKTMEELHAENERLREKLKFSDDDRRSLKERLQQRTADVQVLCKHRQELLQMKKLLRRIGLEEGYEAAENRSGRDTNPLTCMERRKDNSVLDSNIHTTRTRRSIFTDVTQASVGRSGDAEEGATRTTILSDMRSRLAPEVSHRGPHSETFQTIQISS